jgi:hypothetical protein
MTRLFALVLCLVAVLPCAARAADFKLDGIVLRSGIGGLVSLDGAPAGVQSVDAGHRCTWLRNGGTTTVYIDDDALVRAIDVQPGSAAPLSFTLDVDGRPVALAFHTFTSTQADAQLATIAEYSNANERTYRTAANEELALFFDPANTLARAVFGERAQLSRIGVVPADPAGQALNFRAPVAKRLTVVPPLPGGAHAAIARLSIDRTGAVESVSIVVSSGDPKLDAKIAGFVKLDYYRAATVGGRPIAATVFREIR